MYPTFPCPNPTCTHSFSPAAVKGASRLVCPKCGTVFQFGSTAPASAHPVAAKKPEARQAKPAKPTPAPPSAVKGKAMPVPPPPSMPAAQRVPVAVPVSPPVALSFNSSPEMVVPRAQVRKMGKGRLLAILGLCGVVVLGLALAVWGGRWLLQWSQEDSTEDDPAVISSGFNARFPLPGKPWTRDKNIQMKMHVHIAMRSSERNNGLAVTFRDYKNRLPSDAELLDEALTKLRSYFRGLEWEQRTSAEPTLLAGKPAKVLDFQGDDPEQVAMNGECTMMASRGYAYWIFTWAPLGELNNDRESIAGEWAELRQRFSLLDGRKGWTAKPRETERIAGKKAKYQLAYVKGLWTTEPAADYDPQADLVLKGHEPDPERRPLASKVATVEVLVLPKQDNLQAAVTAARDHVQQRERKEYPQTAMKILRDKHGAELDMDAMIGKEAGHLTKLEVTNTEDRKHFLVIAVVNRAEGVLVLVGSCLWERRDFWEQELTSLLDTLKVR